MSVLLFILFGFVVGLIARAITPGRQHLGLLMTTVLGIAGSFLGGAVASLFTHRSITDSGGAGLIGSVIGAVVLLLIVTGVQHRRTRSLA